MPPKGKKTSPRSPRNEEIAPGLMRFSRARMYARNGVYKKKPFPVVKKTAKKVDNVVVKKIGGDKNGKERKVLKSKPASLLGPVREQSRAKHSKRKSQQKLRSTITPGTVLIVLAGRHKGKRVVFLKQLESGLLLITGPLKINNCPLRRIAMCYVIATSTKIDISSVKVPESLNDEYFRRARKNKKSSKNEDTDIFASTKQVYEVSDQRKQDQKTVDSAILSVIKKNKEKKLLLGYLGSTFALNKGQFPHRMKF